MRRPRAAPFEQPSLVPMADMLTNTVGIMLFILIFAALSTSGAVALKHLPRERSTDAKAIFMYCSGGRLARIDADALMRRIEKPLGDPTYATATAWAKRYSTQKIQTDDLDVSGEASAVYDENPFQSSVRLNKAIIAHIRKDRGDDVDAIHEGRSELQALIGTENNRDEFFFFLVDPDSIAIFRAARDRVAKAGFNVGWSSLGPGEPARIGNGGRQAKVS